MERTKVFYIYTLTDPTNDQIRYVGKTSNPVDRLKRHLQKCYLDKYGKNTYKSNWIKGLLERNLSPRMEIIEECSLENVNFLEEYWIEQMKQWGFKLTNLSKGGEIGVDWTGRRHTQDTKDKMKLISSLRYRPVVQFNLNGDILYEYESLTQASSETGIHIYLISNCCKNKGSYTVGGGKTWLDNRKSSTFRYKGDDFDYIPYNKNIQINSKSVCKYNLNGNLIKIYDSIRSGSVDDNINKSNIISCLKRKINKKTGKFIVVKGHTYRLFSETNGEDLITQ